MKSVLRSAFDPVPRPLSQGTQLLVVGVLVVGIAISVVEYLDSSRPSPLAEDSHGRPASSEGCAAPSAPLDLGTRSRSLARAAQRGTTGCSPASASPTEATLPTAVREPSSAAGAPMALQPDEDS